jgi:WD40 repeat protein
MTRDGCYLAVATTNGNFYWRALDPDKKQTCQVPELQKKSTGARNRVQGSRSTILDLAFLDGGFTTLSGSNEKNSCGCVPDLATVGGDGLVHVWKSGGSIGEPIQLRGNGSELRSVAVSNDNSLIVAGNTYNQLQLWDLNTQDYACSMVIRNLTDSELDRFLGPKDKRSIDDDEINPCPAVPADELDQ